MARGRNKGGGDTAVAENTESMEDVMVAPTTEAPEAPVAEDTTSTTESASVASAKAELTDDEINEALAGFIAASTTAAAERDDSTGVVPDAQVDEVNKAYAALDGAKLKNAAKRYLNEAMRDAMNEMDVVQARAYMDLNERLKAGAAKKAGKVKEPKAPVDPTEAFVERIATLSLAYSWATELTVEGVAEDWSDRVDTLLAGIDTDAVTAYQAWLTSTDEDRGDAPEVSTVVAAAVKLALGRSAKPGKAPKRATGDSTYDGPRRDIAKHITEAFGDKDSGEFLLISEIRKFESTEYGTDHPSAGAISARLFPKSGKCTLVGVSPATNDKGDKGAVKD